MEPNLKKTMADLIAKSEKVLNLLPRYESDEGGEEYNIEENLRAAYELETAIVAAKAAIA